MAKIECKGCTPNCPYFPYMDGTVDWEYNEEGLKVRKKKKIFVCYFASCICMCLGSGKGP